MVKNVLTAVLIFSGSLFADSLTISFNTAELGQGGYAPNNIVGIWIMNGAGTQYIRTLRLWTMTDPFLRTSMFQYWNEQSATDQSSQVDAVTSASRQNHTTKCTAKWNLKDKNGVTVPSGTYRFAVEVAENCDAGSFYAYGSIVINGVSKTVSKFTSVTDPGIITNLNVSYVSTSTGVLNTHYTASTMRPFTSFKVTNALGRMMGGMEGKNLTSTALSPSHLAPNVYYVLPVGSTGKGSQFFVK